MKAGKLAIAAIIVIAALGVAIEGERSARSRANYSKARAHIAELQEALRRYRMDNGAYPTTDQGLEALAWHFDGVWELDSNMVVPRRSPARPLSDPWGRPYFYQSDG